MENEMEDEMEMKWKLSSYKDLGRFRGTYPIICIHNANHRLSNFTECALALSGFPTAGQGVA